MTVNDVLTRQNVVTKLLLKDGSKELSKDLKVKIMKMRIEYGKTRKQFDEDLQEFLKGLPTERLNELNAKTDRTEEETAEFNELNRKVGEEYNAYIISRGEDSSDCQEYTFTEEEYEEILEVNAGNDTQINNQNIKAADLLEAIYDLFVK